MGLGSKTKDLWKKKSYRDMMRKSMTKLDISLEELKDKHLSGVPASKLAKEYGCNIGSIIIRLKELGVYTSYVGKFNKHIFGRKHSEEVKKKLSKALKGKNVGKKNGMFKNAKKKAICLNCANVFYGYDNGVRKFKYCSNKCAHEHMGVWNKGICSEKSHFWKDIKKTTLNKFIRKTNLYKEWRTFVFGRDNYTCQKCGSRGVWLEAYHIIPLSEVIKSEQITFKNYDKSCLLFDINNGITLCLNCHSDIDKKRRKFFKK